MLLISQQRSRNLIRVKVCATNRNGDPIVICRVCDETGEWERCRPVVVDGGMVENGLTAEIDSFLSAVSAEILR